MEYEYKLTLNSKQIRETLKAVELLMRLKLNQSFTFSDSIVGWNTEADLWKANRKVAEALGELFKDRPPEKYKDSEWYVLYNLFQVMRYAIHEAENPEGKGVDSYPPLKLTDEPLPKCEWSKT